MSKTKSSKIKQLIEEYGSEYFRGNKETITCILCETEIQVHERRFIERHCNTIKHKKHINLLSNKDQPSELSSSSYQLSNNEFFRDMCEMMINADIPLYKVNNPHFKTFIEKYTCKMVVHFNANNNNNKETIV